MSIAVASASSRSAGPWTCRRPPTTSARPASARSASSRTSGCSACIGELHAANYYAYGYRRMWMALRRAGEHGRPRPRQAADARARDPGRQAPRQAVAHHDARSRGARAARIWSSATSAPTRPGRLWVADFTYLRCWEGLVFFASSSTPTAAGSSAGSSPATCAPTSSSTRCGWRSPAPRARRRRRAGPSLRRRLANPDSTGPRNSVL